MEEPVGLDLKDQSTGTILPVRDAHVALMLVALRCGALHGEGTKGVLAEQGSRRAIERGAVHRKIKRILRGSAKR